MSASETEIVTSHYLVEHPLGPFLGIVNHPKHSDPIEHIKLAWGYTAKYTKLPCKPDTKLTTIRASVNVQGVSFAYT